LTLLLQLRAELEAGLKVAKEASQQAESEREQVRIQQRHLDEERRRLEDFECDLTSRARELETLTQMAVATKEEGRRALEEARKIEKQRSEQAADIHRQLTELRNREKRLAQVRYLSFLVCLYFHLVLQNTRCMTKEPGFDSWKRQKIFLFFESSDWLWGLSGLLFFEQQVSLQCLPTGVT